MKILFIANRGEIGGATTSLENMIRKLSERGNDIVVVTPNKKSIWFQKCKDLNVNCIYCKYYEVGYAFNISTIRKIIKFLLFPILFMLNRLINYYSALKIRSKIDIESFDYIYTNTNRDDFGIILSKIYKVKHIMHLREFDKLFFKILYLRKDIYNYFSNNTVMFFAVSKAIKKYYIEKGIYEGKIYTAYDGFNSNKIKKKYNYIVGNTFKIIMVSNISEEKGQKQLIDAIIEINNKKIAVDFYGTGNLKYIKKLKKIILKNNLDKSITFKGYVENIFQLICNYDLAIMGSKIDGFGLVTVEYMLAGVPVLISNTGANHEIVINDKNGLLFEYNNILDLKLKILYAFNNYNKMVNMAENAYSEAIEKFNLEHYIEQIEKYLEGMK